MHTPGLEGIPMYLRSTSMVPRRYPHGTKVVDPGTQVVDRGTQVVDLGYPCYTHGIMVVTTGMHNTNHTTSTTPTIPTDIIYCTYTTNPTTYISYVVPSTNSSIGTYREGTPGGFPMVICALQQSALAHPEDGLERHTRRISFISTPGGLF